MENETPLASILILSVNIIIESLVSLSLATDPLSDSLLNRYHTKKINLLLME